MGGVYETSAIYPSIWLSRFAGNGSPNLRAIVTTANGDVRVMKVEQRPDPVPSTGQVLVRVKAAGLNFADILARQGLYPDGPRKPCIMGYEVSGVIEEVGGEVDRSLI